MARAATSALSLDGAEEAYINRSGRIPDLIVVAKLDAATTDQLTDAVYVALLEDAGYPDPPVVQATVLGDEGAQVVASSDPVSREPVELVAFAEGNVAVLTSARFT